MSSSTVAKHWIHQRFVQNLVNASRDNDLVVAVREWSFHKLHASVKQHNCQLCNARINVCVTLKNNVNGNFLVLGGDCYDKLLQFLTSGKVESTLPNRTKQSGALRRYWKGLTKLLKDRTVMGWLQEMLDAGTLADDVAEIVYTIVRIGFAPTMADADKVIAFYKATRQFPVASLISAGELYGFSHPRLLPETITVNQIDRVRQLLESDRLMRKARWETKRETERKDAEKRHLVGRYNIMHDSLHSMLSKLQAAHARGVDSAAKSVASAERIMARVAQAVAALVSSDAPNLDDWRNDVRILEDLIDELLRSLHWHTVEPEIIFSVQGRYGLIQRDGRWKPIWRAEVFKVKSLESETGLYKAIVLEDVYPMRVKLLEKLDSSQVLFTLDFTEPSRNKPGTYVAILDNKIVLPSRDVRKPGKHQTFILNDEGRYYRAWVID